MHVPVCVERYAHLYEDAHAKQDNYEHMMEKFYGPMFWYDAHHSGQHARFLVLIHTVLIHTHVLVRCAPLRSYIL